MPLTCHACHLEFGSGDQQRQHYRTDWHQHNLKRKVAELPPITFDQFTHRLQVLQSRSAQQQESQAFQKTCTLCDRTYSSPNAHQDHLASRKHKEREAKQSVIESDNAKQQSTVVSKADQVSVAQDTEQLSQMTDIRRRLLEAKTESEVEKLLEERRQLAPKLDPKSDCLFCLHRSDSLENHLEHMTHDHSFFIPDLDYLVDLEGLLQYLSDKVSVDNLCLYCNGKGRAFYSLEAVRKHMVDKGHTKMCWDDDGDLEYADFYDYSSTWTTSAENDVAMPGEPGGGALVPVKGSIGSELELDETGLELVLPTGSRLGHRSLARYYKQRFHTRDDDRESMVIGRLAEQYKSLGWPALESVSYRRTQYRQQHNRATLDLRVGTNANKLQRYYRAQVDF